MNQEKIVKLITSNNPQDIEIGIILAGSKLGKEWCKQTLTAQNSNKYKTRYYENIGMGFFVFPEFRILAGSMFFEYISNEDYKKDVYLSKNHSKLKRGLNQIKIIYEYSTDKQISEV